MKLSEWRKSRRAEASLPSGLDVQLQKVSLVDLAAEGKIPAPLLGTIDEMTEMTEDVMIDLAEFPKYAEAINVVASAVILDPPVAEEPDAEHLGVHELPFEDRVWLFNWANEEAGELAGFREEQGAGNESAFDGADVQPETE